MATYKDLLAQRAALESQIAEARKTELAAAVRQVRDIVAEFELTESDVFGGRGNGQRATKGTIVAPKYRDPATGATWTGRGKAPRWIQGQDREKFAI